MLISVVGYAQNPINLKTQTNISDYIGDELEGRLVDTLSTLSDTTAAVNEIGRIVHVVSEDAKWTVGSDGFWREFTTSSPVEICKVGQDPNLIPELETIDPATECLIARDTVNNITYEYDASLAVGSRWKIPIAPSNLAREGANNNDVIRWNSVSGQWEPAAVNDFEFADTVVTITVCNNLDTCDALYISDALSIATAVKSSFDTTNNSRVVRIVQRPNPDGSIMYFRTAKGQDTTFASLIIEGGDFSGIELSSRYKDSTYTLVISNNYDPEPSDWRVINLVGVHSFTINDFSVVGRTPIGDRGLINAYTSHGVTLRNITTDSLGYHAVNVQMSSVYVVNSILKNTLGFGAIASYQGELIVQGSSVINNKGYGILNRGYLQLDLTRVCNNDINIRQGGFLVADDNTVFAIDTMPNNVHLLHERSAISLMNNSTNNSPLDNNIPYNQLTGLGILFNSRFPYPFQEFTTATEPAASSGIRYYYNTDDNEVKISKNDLTWEPLVPKDTLVYTFPILPYNGTDTIADQLGFEEYLTTITPEWANRKVVAFEITTTDTVSTDLYLQLYEENIVAGTSAQPIPPTTNFVLPQGQQFVRFTTADAEIPVQGIEFTLARAMYAEVMNGSAAGSSSYVATEGANGIYITFYLIE